MGFFSQSSMQRNPLFQGSMFSNWKLHARSNFETSHQVSLPLDSWHAHHNLDVIKTHQSDAAKLIPHINLATLTSHITSRSSRHIHLSCFGVSPLHMPCSTFPVTYFCFPLWEYYLLDFFEHFLSLTYILACPRSISVFVAISLLSHA